MRHMFLKTTAALALLLPAISQADVLPMRSGTGLTVTADGGGGRSTIFGVDVNGNATIVGDLLNDGGIDTATSTALNVGATNATQVNIDSTTVVNDTGLGVGVTPNGLLTSAGVQAFPAGKLTVTRDGNSTFALNRLTSGGSVADFYSDSVQKGGIGVDGTSVYFYGGSTYTNGLRIDTSSVNSSLPVNVVGDIKAYRNDGYTAGEFSAYQSGGTGYWPILYTVHGRGSKASPSQTLANDVIGQWQMYGTNVSGNAQGQVTFTGTALYDITSGVQSKLELKIGPTVYQSWHPLTGITLNAAMTVQGTDTVATFGSGGTGTDDTYVVVDAGNGSGGEALLFFKHNSVNTARIGTSSSGNLDLFTYGSGNITLTPGASTAATISTTAINTTVPLYISSTLSEVFEASTSNQFPVMRLESTTASSLSHFVFDTNTAANAYALTYRDGDSTLYFTSAPSVLNSGGTIESEAELALNASSVTAKVPFYVDDIDAATSTNLEIGASTATRVDIGKSGAQNRMLGSLLFVTNETIADGAIGRPSDGNIAINGDSLTVGTADINTSVPVTVTNPSASSQISFGRTSTPGWGYLGADSVWAFRAFSGGTGSTPSLVTTTLLGVSHAGAATIGPASGTGLTTAHIAEGPATGSDYAFIIDVNKATAYGLHIRGNGVASAGYPLLNVSENGTSNLRVDSGGTISLENDSALKPLQIDADIASNYLIGNADGSYPTVIASLRGTAYTVLAANATSQSQATDSWVATTTGGTNRASAIRLGIDNSHRAVAFHTAAAGASSAAFTSYFTEIGYALPSGEWSFGDGGTSDTSITSQSYTKLGEAVDDGGTTPAFAVMALAGNINCSGVGAQVSLSYSGTPIAVTRVKAIMGVTNATGVWYAMPMFYGTNPGSPPGVAIQRATSTGIEFRCGVVNLNAPVRVYVFYEES